VKLRPKHADNLIERISATPFVIYGMGYVGNLIAEWCDQNGIGYVFCDSNAEQKRGEAGREAIVPEQLLEKYPDANIVVASINYYDEIKARLAQLGVDGSCVLSYLEFWPEHTDWEELEAAADWGSVRRRAEIFSAWIDPSAGSVADYSCEKNFLRDLLPKTVQYESPHYIRFRDNKPYGDFSELASTFRVDVSSCLAMLMSFSNPEDVIDHMCRTTEKAIVASYVPLEALPDLPFRRSINYNNDYTEQQFISMFGQRGFRLIKSGKDPFDAVHTVYLFQRQRNKGG